jgi:hypothetical protein
MTTMVMEVSFLGSLMDEPGWVIFYDLGVGLNTVKLFSGKVVAWPVLGHYLVESALPILLLKKVLGVASVGDNWNIQIVFIVVRLFLIVCFVIFHSRLCSVTTYCCQVTAKSSSCYSNHLLFIQFVSVHCHLKFLIVNNCCMSACPRTTHKRQLTSHMVPTIFGQWPSGQVHKATHLWPTNNSQMHQQTEYVCPTIVHTCNNGIKNYVSEY